MDAQRRSLALPPLPAGVDPGIFDPAEEAGRSALIAAAHPELDEALADDLDELEIDGRTTSPGLHLAMHEAVANQLWDGEPPQTWRTAQRLHGLGYELHELHHMLGGAFAGELWHMQHDGEPFDEARFAAALDALPTTWEAQREQGDASGDPNDVGDRSRFRATAEDEDAYQAAHEELLERFAAWSATGGEDDGWFADQLLHHKWGYLDGDLVTWRTADLDEVLLELFPRKLLLERAEDADQIVPEVGRFLAFLDDQGLLGGDPLGRLRSHLAAIGADVSAAVRDPARAGLAKGLFQSMLGEGVDPSDQAAVQSFMDDFNARPFAERAAAIPGPPRLVLPPSPRLDGAERDAAALETGMVRQLAAFCDWVGGGRALTGRGNLTLAGGRELIDLLATDDVMDPVIGDRTFSTSSSAELRGVDRVYRIALKASLARRRKGRLLRTKRGERVGAEPFAVWRDALDALLELGLLTHGQERRYFAWHTEFCEEQAAGLLTFLHAAGGVLPVAALAEQAHELLGDAYDLASPRVANAEMLRTWTGGSVERMVDVLVWVGAVEREEVAPTEDAGEDTEDDGDEGRAVRGGAARLTPLGYQCTGPLLVEAGLEVPTRGDYRQADAADLLRTAVRGWTPEVLEAEARLWAADRSDPVAELLEAAREPDPPEARLAAFVAMDAAVEDPSARVAALREDPRLRAVATLWLLEREFIDPAAVDPEDLPVMLADQLAVTLATEGPSGVLAFVDAAEIPPEALVAVTGHLWPQRGPQVADVLEALAGSTDKRVTKAARKALFRHRSAR